MSRLRSLYLLHHPTPTLIIMATRVLERALPDLDEPIVEYLAGYVDAPEDPRDDVLDLVRAILESATASDPKASASVDDVLRELAALLPESSTAEGPLLRLDRVVDMGRTELSRTAGFDQAGGVDLALGGTTKARSAVDVKKLEKQEEKTRAKLQKRAQRDLYESSKLVENARKQETYEEMFLKVNPLENAANKSKNKDVHLPNIDLSFGSNRLLSGASLTLAQGRRYGLIGRNGESRPAAHLEAVLIVALRHGQEYAAAQHGAARGADPDAHFHSVRRAGSHRRQHQRHRGRAQGRRVARQAHVRGGGAQR
jgi:ATP-binding cassette subfamily F protein 3